MRSSRVRSEPYLALLAVLALLAAGCAPTTIDDATRVDYREDETFVVPAGDALHVSLDRSLDDVGLTEAGLRRSRLSWIPLGIRGESANAATITTVEGIEAPDDWSVQLWRARVVRERPLGERGAAPDYRLEAEVRVEVPASAAGLTRRVRARLHVQGGEVVPLDFLVRAE